MMAGADSVVGVGSGGAGAAATWDGLGGGIWVGAGGVFQVGEAFASFGAVGRCWCGGEGGGWLGCILGSGTAGASDMTVNPF
jgi:hypothetical protein